MNSGLKKQASTFSKMEFCNSVEKSLLLELTLPERSWKEWVLRESPRPFLSEQRRIKQEMGIPSEPSQERIGDKSASLSKISFLVRPVLERLSAEIGRSLDYYRSQFNEERIDRLLLTGGGANLKNIVSHLAGELRLPVEHFNPLSKILFDSKKVDTQFLNQIGFTLRHRGRNGTP